MAWLSRNGILALCAVLVLLGSFLACRKPAGENAKRSATTPETPAATSDFTLSIATGGGFTGLVSGYTLHSDGRVTHWQRYPAGKDTMLWSTHADSTHIAQLRQMLLDAGMTQETIRGSGNITTTVSYTTADSTYTWSWSGTGPESDLPPEVARWYRRVERFCDQVEARVKQ